MLDGNGRRHDANADRSRNVNAESFASTRSSDRPPTPRSPPSRIPKDGAGVMVDAHAVVATIGKKRPRNPDARPWPSVPFVPSRTRAIASGSAYSQATRSGWFGVECGRAGERESIVAVHTQPRRTEWAAAVRKIPRLRDDGDRAQTGYGRRDRETKEEKTRPAGLLRRCVEFRTRFIRDNSHRPRRSVATTPIAAPDQAVLATGRSRLPRRPGCVASRYEHRKGRVAPV